MQITLNTNRNQTIKTINKQTDGGKKPWQQCRCFSEDKLAEKKGNSYDFILLNINNIKYRTVISIFQFNSLLIFYLNTIPSTIYNNLRN